MSALPSQEERAARNLDRVVFFADAVFAIAITLLVVAIDIPHVASSELAHTLRHEWPQFFSFALSFVVIGNWWVVHHRTFAFIVRVDQRLLLLQLIFLLAVAFTPFPTALLGDYGSSRTSTVLYAATLAAVGLSAAMLWRYASSGRRLVAPELTDQRIRHLQARALVVPAVFLISIPIAFLSVDAAQFAWISIVVLMPLVMRFYPDSDPGDS